MHHPLLNIHDLRIDFDVVPQRVTAVQNMNLQVNRGEIVAIVGESGSGKSVTALSILRLLPSPPAVYASGSILFSPDGNTTVDLLTIPDDELRTIRGNGIAMIFQEPMTSLNPVLTCGDQVMEAIMLHQKISRSEATDKTLRLFGKVQLPDPDTLFNRYPHQLSGGQKQRVMIAMAMSCEPALLICDEPTTALDVTVQKTILTLIKELQQTEQMGVIFITHDLGVVAEIADRALVMYKGEIVEAGPVHEIFRSPRHPYTRGLLMCRPALHPRGSRLPVVADFLTVDSALSSIRSNQNETAVRPHEVPAGTLVQDNDRVLPFTGNVVSKVKPGLKEAAGRQVLMRVTDLDVWFPLKRNLFGKPKSFLKAVDNVSFDVYAGETLGLVGESGCGKTTLGRTLLGLIKPVSGTIEYKNRDIASLTEKEMRFMRQQLQIVFQDPYSSLNPRMTIGAAIAEPLRLLTKRDRKAKVIDLLEKVNLKPEHYGRYPHEFSGGQRQRIVIARALAMGPSFLVCDESVSALDVSVQAQVLNLLNELKKEFRLTVVFISHDLGVVRFLSDRIMVMNQGKIVESGDAETVYRQPRTEYTRRLVASIPGLPA
ncbi:MAG: ABC transporter ATP-binding protein [Chitinophagaceae bacterium]|nr:MAG: ABC transporter ATP-binding protein [Chitinophagaceae bacterium]